MRSKKIITKILAACLSALLLCGCGAKTTGETIASSTEAAGVTTGNTASGSEADTDPAKLSPVTSTETIAVSKEKVSMVSGDVREAIENKDIVKTEQLDFVDESMDLTAINININPMVTLYIDGDGVVVKYTFDDADAVTYYGEKKILERNFDDIFMDLVCTAYDEGLLSKEDSKLEVTVEHTSAEHNAAYFENVVAEQVLAVCRDTGVDHTICTISNMEENQSFALADFDQADKILSGEALGRFDPGPEDNGNGEGNQDDGNGNPNGDNGSSDDRNDNPNGDNGNPDGGDPANPENNEEPEDDTCPVCEGTGTVDCILCDATGRQICGRCNGTGEAECGRCNGGGMAECGACDGAGTRHFSGGSKDCPYCTDGIKWVVPGDDEVRPGVNDGPETGIAAAGGYYDTCDFCHGKGVIVDAPRDETCNDCKGTGIIVCNDCEGQGKRQCDDCYGAGDIECPDCNGRIRIECGDCGGTGRRQQ